MNIKQIEREQMFAEIIAERDAIIRNLATENVQMRERINELEATQVTSSVNTPAGLQ